MRTILDLIGRIFLIFGVAFIVCLFAFLMLGAMVLAGKFIVFVFGGFL